MGRPAGIPNKSTREAIAMLREQAKEMVAGLLSMTKEMRDDPVPCPMCGRGMMRDEDTRIKALIAALDRAGVGPHSKVEVEQVSDTEWMRHLSDDQLATLEGWIDVAQAKAAEVDGTRERVN